MTNEKVYAMPFSKVYPLLTVKAQRKGRTREEVDQIICWLTGYSQADLAQKLAEDTPYGRFFLEAPCLNPSRRRITGSVCGVKLDSIEDPLMLEIRYLDKLIDELAKGKAMEKILRK
ncbi:MAG: DUF2200 domain-containing protein [Eubacteriales bacterium]|nr:DUF2200 domain-containing protein [Eubacteriales bacterium]